MKLDPDELSPAFIEGGVMKLIMEFQFRSSRSGILCMCSLHEMNLWFLPSLRSTSAATALNT